MRRTSRLGFLVAVAPFVLLAAACAPSKDTAEVVIFAAASTADVVDQVVKRVQSEQPSAHITVTYGGSADLAAQILEGAPAAVFLSANQVQMAAVAEQAHAGSPQVFATNSLTIVVPAGNPAEVTGLADLENADLTSVICAPQVPCGAATAQLAALDGLTLSPASQENSVTDVLGKVVSGQADAGVVYVSDLNRVAGVEEVPIAGAEQVVNQYQVAILDGEHDMELAGAFVDELVGDYGRGVLLAAGFGVPSLPGEAPLPGEAR